MFMEWFFILIIVMVAQIYTYGEISENHTLKKKSAHKNGLSSSKSYIRVNSIIPMSAS